MTTTNPFAPSPVPSSSFFDAISGSSLCRSLSRGADLIHSIRCSPLSRTSSRTASCGKAKRSPAISTIRAATIASVSGILITKLVPLPGADTTSTVPPICSILLRTISMPTLRPEMLVTSNAVEKPGAKIRLLISACDFDEISDSPMRPASSALALMRAVSRPRPSSAISITT